MPYAVVTGASGGIGFELAKLLAADKYDLLLVARNSDKLKAAAEGIEKEFSVRVHYIPADLSQEQTPLKIYTTAIHNNFDVEVLINNAGYGLNGEFAEIPADEQENMIMLNCTGLVNLTRMFLPHMLKRKSGKILNVASTAAFAAGPFMAVYYASKAFVLSFSEAISYETKRSGVSVICLAPGPVDTGFQQRAGIGKTMLLKAQSVMKPENAARSAYAAMKKGKTLVIPGLMNKLTVFGSRLLPRKFNTAFTGWLNKNRK